MFYKGGALIIAFIPHGRSRKLVLDDAEVYVNVG